MTIPYMLAGSLFFSTPPRLAMNPTQSTVTSAQEALFSVAARPDNEAKHSPPSDAEKNNAWSCTSSRPLLFGSSGYLSRSG